MRCGDLQGAWLQLRAYDFAMIRVEGVRVGSVWRGYPRSLHLRNHCTAPERLVELSITVAAYGRDNFFPRGTPTALSKGIVGDVALQTSKGAKTVLHGWYIAAMPLVQPGIVLKWDGAEANVTTAELVRSDRRMPFDSKHAGVWHPESRTSQLAGSSSQEWDRAPVTDGPTFHRQAPSLVDVC